MAMSSPHADTRPSTRNGGRGRPHPAGGRPVDFTRGAGRGGMGRGCLPPGRRFQSFVPHLHTSRPGGLSEHLRGVGAARRVRRRGRASQGRSGGGPGRGAGSHGASLLRNESLSDPRFLSERNAQERRLLGNLQGAPRPHMAAGLRSPVWGARITPRDEGGAGLRAPGPARFPLGSLPRALRDLPSLSRKMVPPRSAGLPKVCDPKKPF